MKIRYGFVSNSSSSSFVISIKESKPCPHCGRKDINILDLIEKESSINDETSIRAKGVKEIEREFFSWFGKEKFVDKLIEECQKETKKGNTIALIGISYHDEIMRTILGDSKDIEILWNEEE